MRRRVLLSIHPEHAEAILNGQKHYEFRRVLFRERVKEVVLYATTPVCRVIGKFEIEDIYSDSPEAVWSKALGAAGISHERFQNYFLGRDLAHAIKVSKPVRFSQSKPLSLYLKSNSPPQSFCYL